MNIPVCYIEDAGNIIGTSEFDGTRFIDSFDKTTIDRDLPFQNYRSCEIANKNHTCTVVGRDKREYVICFGDNSLYRVNRAALRKYNISNAIEKSGRLTIIDQVGDLGCRFPDKNIGFHAECTEINQSCIGMARKFYGTYNGFHCIVKFSKRSDLKDIQNEIKYYQIAKILGVKCCRVMYSKYDNRDCCISLFEYNRCKEVFSSFKKLNRPIGSIYESLSEEDKIEFDKMMMLDYVLSQQDRHDSNLALLNDGMYPLFDNGECLGIGSIGPFSENLRRYVKRLPQEYRKQIIKFSRLAEVYDILSKDEIELVKRNIEELQV